MMTTSFECYKHEMFQKQKIGYPPTSSAISLDIKNDERYSLIKTISKSIPTRNVQPNQYGTSNIVLARHKSCMSLKEDYDSTEMDETGDLSRNKQLPNSTLNDAENNQGNEITSNNIEKEHNEYSNLNESIQPCKIFTNKRDSTFKNECLDYSFGNSKSDNNEDRFDIHTANISSNDESLHDISQSSDHISPTTNLRVPNFGNKSRINNSDFKGSLIVLPRSNQIKHNSSSKSFDREIVYLGTNSTDAYYVDKTEYRKTVNGRNKRHFLEFISREKPVISISDKSSEKTKQQLNRDYCKAYREKQRYKKDLMIKERKELAERNKKLKNKLKTLHQELESLKMEVNQILNVRSNQSKH